MVIYYPRKIKFPLGDALEKHDFLKGVNLHISLVIKEKMYIVFYCPWFLPTSIIHQNDKITPFALCLSLNFSGVIRDAALVKGMITRTTIHRRQTKLDLVTDFFMSYL